MSGKFIVAIAAVAALGMSTLIASDAFARGGGHGGGGHGGGHGGGYQRGPTHTRTVTRPHTRTVTRIPRGTNNKYAGRPNVNRHPNHPHRTHYARYHHGHHWWWFCRHHPARCGGTWIDVGGNGGVPPVDVVAPAPRPVAVVTPPAAVCTSDCDYFVKDEPGCYMAKRAFSTPAGDELRCVKICEGADGSGRRAEK
jgi:hypothetical protein